MKTAQYILIESSYWINGIRYSTYGIAQADLSEGYAVIVKAIPDLSQDKERVQHLAKVCTELQLSPVHLTDIVNDFLAD